MRRILNTYDFVGLAEDIGGLFSDLEKGRPDVGEFHVWVQRYVPTLREQAESLDLVGINKTLIIFLEMVAGNRSNAGNILSLIKSLEAKLVAETGSDDLESLLEEFLHGVESFVEITFQSIGTKAKLPVSIDGNVIRIGQNAKVSFNRTLRIPEDGRDYPLPAGFGRLPVCRVEDYADKVPQKWLQEGGFFIPLYQKEALFLEFGGAKWRPNAAKVAVGRVNAVTGSEYDEKIRRHKQDYLVIPDQKWLDGINSGEGRVGQFVAMPLGKGYTIEGQITDEELHGGFQLVVFDPNEGRFPDEDPIEARRRQDRLERRKLPIVAAGAAILGAAAVKPSAGLFMPHPGTDQGVLYSPARPAVTEMGIARGGSIKQEILEDTYGSESWNEECNGSITIHIVNSEVYQQITGEEPPPSPITLREYKKYNIPWYDSYDETSSALLPGKMFQHVKSIASLEKVKGLLSQKAESFEPIPSELIRKIKTPTKEERIAAFVERAGASLKGGFYSEARREASFAIDLSKGSSTGKPLHVFALQIRAEANLALGIFLDAEGDASDCLELDGKNLHALSTRAQALMKMGEHKLASDDARKILRSEPNHAAGRKIAIEALLTKHLTRLVENREVVESTLRPAFTFAEKLIREDEALHFIDCVELDEAHPDGSIEAIIRALDFRKINKERRAAVRSFETMVFKIFIANYYPRVVAESADAIRSASKILIGRFDSVPAISRHRSIPTVRQVIDLGLQPLSLNPTVLFILLWWEMDKFATAQKLIAELFEQGLARFCASPDMAPSGWDEIDSNLCSSDHKEKDLFGKTMPEQGSLNLFSTLTPGQREEVMARDAGLFNVTGSTQYADAIESLTAEPVFSPAPIAKFLNEALVPGRGNYKSLNLIDGKALLPDSLWVFK
jgi:tetratricopeptide (TPR) repeat protein